MMTKRNLVTNRKNPDWSLKHLHLGVAIPKIRCLTPGKNFKGARIAA